MRRFLALVLGLTLLATGAAVDRAFGFGADAHDAWPGERTQGLIPDLVPLGLITADPFEVQLPKWKTSTMVNLVDDSSTVGASPGSYPGISPGVFLGAAAHAADIAVDETGTVAAASTRC